MEKKVMQTYLYDFYGDLLTEHQRTIYEEYVWNDLSLSEIAQEKGISRQGVHDLVRRCDRILADYEEKLHLLERFLKNKEKILKIQTLSRNYQNGKEAQAMAEIEAISNEILEEL
ncbi:YlxM family DNA-binding protein [Lachnospiraceae bacterium 45-W7]